MLVIQGLKLGKNFATISSELNVAEATAEVYGIDCLAAGADLDHESVAKCLKVSKESFDVIKCEIMAKRTRNFAPYGTTLVNYSPIIKYVLC